MSTGNVVNSSEIIIFPASRRNVQFYTSRIMSEDNYRRAIQAAVNVSGYEKGTFIYNGKAIPDGTKLAEDNLEFFLGGYYIRIYGSDCEAIKAVNSKLGVSGGTLWFYIRQEEIANAGTDPANFYFSFKELVAAKGSSNIDDGGNANGVYKCYALGWAESSQAGCINIPIVVPRDGDGTDSPGVLNPALDKDNIYKPWFLSSASWAASMYSDKNKIWVDDVYNVPHICLTISGKQKWVPLGAVYKSSLPS